MDERVGRRRILSGAGAALLLTAMQGCSPGQLRGAGGARGAAQAAPPQLPPLHVAPDQITRITVCTRPFRAAGPRLDVEQLGLKTVVHNYGHGGSGWSLSWGSSGIAVRKALASGTREIAVIGCGALGLTSATLLQRAGIDVTIYAKDLPPNVRSSLATGLWSPDSRICLEENATPAFRQLWEGMARESFETYQTLLGLPGDPVEFIDSYALWDRVDWDRRGSAPRDPRPPFADLADTLLGDLSPDAVDLAPGTHDFGDRHALRFRQMMFNLGACARLLMEDFLVNHGRIQIAEFRTPADLAALPQKTLINATGYGARALFDDRTVIPVRGQLARMAPQSDVHYGLYYRHAAFVPRRDGAVFQYTGDSDYYGFDDATTVPSREEAELAVNTIAGLYAPAS